MKFLIALFLSADLAAFVVGTNAEFPPYSYIDQGKIVGFDIDIAQEVASRMGQAIAFKDMPFDALIPELVLGRVDFVAAGLTATEERAKRVSFTKSYLNPEPFVIFSKDPELKNLAQLKGKTVVVVEGFTADSLVSAIEGITVVRLPLQADAFMAVKSQRADAFVTAASTVRSFTETQKGGQFYTAPLEGTGETCSLAFPLQSKALLAEVQSVLDQIEQDGSLEKIRKQWSLQ